ncbi:MAG: hypothetical protein CBD16_01975 [Betaproteobacteria bacterium TMED156]|nr:MAG: hypothetical protein CBD16_01975 [Betaproteobacteria bacterium TMED156]
MGGKSLGPDTTYSVQSPLNRQQIVAGFLNYLGGTKKYAIFQRVIDAADRSRPDTILQNSPPTYPQGAVLANQ